MASLFGSTTLQKWRLILLPSYPTTFTSTWLWICWTHYWPVNIYLLKFNNGNTGTLCEFCLKLTIPTGKNCVLLNSVQEWLPGHFWSFLYVYTINEVLYIPLSRIKSTNVWKMWFIKQIVKMNFSASFTGKFGLVFVLTLEKA